MVVTVKVKSIPNEDKEDILSIEVASYNRRVLITPYLRPDGNLGISHYEADPENFWNKPRAVPTKLHYSTEIEAVGENPALRQLGKAIYRNLSVKTFRTHDFAEIYVCVLAAIADAQLICAEEAAYAKAGR